MESGFRLSWRIKTGFQFISPHYSDPNEISCETHKTAFNSIKLQLNWIQSLLRICKLFLADFLGNLSCHWKIYIAGDIYSTNKSNSCLGLFPINYFFYLRTTTTISSIYATVAHFLSLSLSLSLFLMLSSSFFLSLPSFSRSRFSKIV